MQKAEPNLLFCENTSANLIAEPLNALTTLAFFVVSAFLYRLAQGQARALVMIGMILLAGAMALLTHALSSEAFRIASVVASAGFVVTYTFAFARDVMGQSRKLSISGAVIMVPYVIGVQAVFDLIPGLGLSSYYGPIALAFFGLGIIVSNHAPDMTRNLFLGTAGMLLAVPLRAADLAFCETWPIGTHFIWHIVIAAVMGWLVHGYLRHVLAGRDERG